MIAIVMSLDEKEKQIVKLLSKGVSYQDMAKVVFLSPPTISRKLKELKKYYQVESNIELVTKLLELGEL